MSRRGVLFLLGVLVLVSIPPADKVRRKYFYKPPDVSVWLEVKGNFADHPMDMTEPDNPPISISAGDGDEPQKAAIPGRSSVWIPARCVLLKQEQSMVHNGCMLLLDSSHSYSGYEGEMTSTAHSKGGYGVHGTELPLQPCALEALDKMTKRYTSSTGQHNLLVYSTTKAGGIYDRELPDMATGYCVDLATEDEKGRIEPFYSRSIWLSENAYRYGFVFSYTEAEEETTGISDVPYHLRYVGRIHAGLMHELGLTLSAYLKLVQSHSTDDPLYYEDGNQVCTVYYVPQNGGETEVPVPKNGNYEISGDNIGGFIVAAEGKYA